MNAMTKTVHGVASNATDASDSTGLGLNEATKGKQVVNTAINSINKQAEEILRRCDRDREPIQIQYQHWRYSQCYKSHHRTD